MHVCQPVVRKAGDGEHRETRGATLYTVRAGSLISHVEGFGVYFNLGDNATGGF